MTVNLNEGALTALLSSPTGPIANAAVREQAERLLRAARGEADRVISDRGTVRQVVQMSEIEVDAEGRLGIRVGVLHVEPRKTRDTSVSEYLAIKAEREPQSWLEQAISDVRGA